ncbi:3'-5' exonuclease [Halosquirtibacter laminarini]|uniref:3'-5' exonuclease n=1 Tax=Halosquirtibacter laminarini TaxID=3374600 RepID=A0AC61NJM6_9BACT|nr:3'-5' exonuclease [Prolixibacteraceae bacterium]
MNLNLKNPIVFLDLETTGLDIVNDRIIEFAFLKINIDGSEEELEMRINPEKKISKEAMKVHHITDEDVANCSTFKEKAKEVARFIEGCDLAGFNSNRFDIPLLSEEFLRSGVDIDLKKRKFVDVQTIFHKMEKRTLAAAFKMYCNQEMENAHSAMYDTRATYEVLKAQLDRYENTEVEDNGKAIIPIQNDIKALSEFSCYDHNVDFAGRIVYNNKKIPVFNFGKNKGRPVLEVLEEQPGYYGWMLGGDFPLYTKKVLTQIRLDDKLKK